ncbi:PAS domain S-box protein, partial [bacterium]
MLKNALIGFHIMLILTLIFITAIIKKVVSPIGKLANAARGISEGNYNTPIDLTDDDNEVGALANAFSTMAKGIKERDEGLRAEIERSHTYLEVAGSIFLVLNSSGKVLLINKKGCEILGYGYAEVIGRSWIDVFIPERDRAEIKKTFSAIITGEIAPYENYENRILAKNGDERIIAWQNAVLKDASGAIYTTVSSGSDITEKRRAEEAERLNAERISRQQKAIIRLAARAATIIEDLPGALRYITKTAADTLESEHVCVWIFSESRKQLKCANHFEKSSNTHSEGYSFDIDKAAGYISAIESERAVAAEDAQNDPLTAELNDVFLKPRGIISLLSAPIRIAGKLRGVATFAHSSRKKTWFADEISFSAVVADQLAQAFIEDERAKKEAELKKLSMVIEHSVNIVFITDSAGVIEYTNPVFETVTGYASGEAIGKNASILASDEVSKDEYRDMWQLLKDGNTWRGIFKNKKKDGSFYWCNTVITPIKDDFGVVTKFLSVQEDITEKRVSEEKIRLLEDYDTVTGLFNREHFMKEMNNCLSETQKLGLHGVLMVIDLDHFQYLNDTYGHAYGDQTLKHVAGVIDDAVNEISAKLSLKIKGFTGRLCSDEFAVFLPDIGMSTALANAEGIRSKIASFSSAQHSEHLTASIGIALMPEHGIVTSELFSKADAATFRAKELGRNRIKLFSAEDKDLENMHIRLNQKERILKALEEDRFIPWFQPILDIKKNIVTHYEALARMRSEDGSILLPGAFIDTAERFGLVGAIDKIIINKTMVR